MATPFNCLWHEKQTLAPEMLVHAGHCKLNNLGAIYSNNAVRDCACSCILLYIFACALHCMRKHTLQKRYAQTHTMQCYALVALWRSGALPQWHALCANTHSRSAMRKHTLQKRYAQTHTAEALCANTHNAVLCASGAMAQWRTATVACAMRKHTLQKRYVPRGQGPRCLTQCLQCTQQ